MRLLKSLAASILFLGLAASATGCAYSGVAATSDGNVIVTRNDLFLFGALREIYVCKVTPNGLASCAKNEAP